MAKPVQIVKRQVSMSAAEYELYQRLSGAGGFCAFAAEALREKASAELQRLKLVGEFMRK